MKTLAFSSLMLISFLSCGIASDQNDSMSPLKKSDSEDFQRSTNRQDLDDSIYQFLQQENLFSKETTHPFEQEPIDYPSYIKNDPKAKKAYRRLLRQDDVREQVYLHNQKRKPYFISSSKEVRKTELAPILLSESH